MLTLEKIFASLPKTERGKAIVLGGDPKGENFLYVNGNSVFIRSLKDPFTKCDVYTQHSTATGVAKYSPSGFYIASGDASGKVRIWDTTQAEHVLKNEFHVLGGAIRDLAWTSDNQRLIIVGEGREKFGVAILADSGASVGEIIGHSKAINSVDFKPQRPFRAVTASEDFVVCFYEGPPFKFKKQNDEHTNFVNVVRYAPSGELFASAGSTGRILLHEGKTSEYLGEIGDPAHKGGIYSLAFSPNSDRLLSVSGDKTARLWNVQDKSLIGEWSFGNTINDMQVSCLWCNDYVITVSLDGSLNFLDLANPGKPTEVIGGHSKPITALDRSADGRTLVTGSTDASLVIWDSASGRMRRVTGLAHKNQIQALAVDASGTVYSVSSSADAAVRADSPAPRKLDSQPVDASAAADLVAIACRQHLVLLRSPGAVVATVAASALTCCALSPDGATLAVGGADAKAPIRLLSTPQLAEIQSVAEHQAEVTALAYSPDGANLAAGFADRYVRVYSVANGYGLANTEEWCFHTARVNCLAWTHDSKYLATGSLDCSIIVWSLDSPRKRIVAKNAHPMSQITKLTWIDANHLVSTGQDSNIKVWNVSFD
uniref:Actin-interacting protein 1 n=1 Tax=Macrostomum lignano TaxID=282301 RepID=A0A1I8IDN5_9PLAT